MLQERESVKAKLLREERARADTLQIQVDDTIRRAGIVRPRGDGLRRAKGLRRPEYVVNRHG
jgi:hypothetical protein